jgi:arsenate reductase
MSAKPYNVLFLCTGNSARSILGEALMNQMGAGRFRAYSGGSRPKGEVHPMTREVLADLGFPTEGLRSKSWDEFTAPGAPEFDFIFTVCDNAAGESCPAWPGRPLTAHWGVEDPATVTGEGQRQAFVDALRYLHRRIELFLMLPHSSIDEMAMRGKLAEIGRAEGASKGSGRNPMATDIVIYHNPECGTSRNALAMIRNAGIEPHVVEYLKTPPSRALLQNLVERAGITPRELLREKGTPYAELGLDDAALSDAQLFDAMMAHPVLINRPLVVSPLGVKLCRPSETVLDLIPAEQTGAFTKEDGEQVVGTAGQRVR